MTSSFRRKRMAVLIGFILVLLAVADLLYPLPFFHAMVQDLDYLIYDTRLNYYKEPKPKTDPVVIVDIDEKSLQQEGHWPWARYRLIELLNILRQEGALVVGFDIVFAEAEPNSAEFIVKRSEAGLTVSNDLKTELAHIQPLIDGDSQFAQAIEHTDTVLGFLFHYEKEAAHGELPKPLLSLTDIEASELTLLSLPGFTGNVSILNQAAGSSGFITNIRDKDNVIRRSPLIIRYENKVYGSLGFEVARLYLMAKQVRLIADQVADHLVLGGLKLGSKMIQTDALGQVLVPYLGPAKTFPSISAGTVFNHKIPSGFFKNKVVLIGTTALGLEDLRSTPFGRDFSGVEIHANIAHALIHGEFPYEPDWVKSITFLVVLIMGAILAYTLPYMAVFSILFSLVVTSGTLVWCSCYAWVHYHLSIPVALPIVLFIILAIFNESHGYLRAKRNQAAITNMFGQYVPTAYVRQMSDSPSHNFGLQGENREMTVLFSDIRSFTTISEGLSAQELKQLLNRFFTPMTKIIFDYDGTIDKYVGDMVMSFWGAPLWDEFHSYKAVSAALEMVRQKEKMKLEFKNLGLPQIDVGIGINTGWMNVGDMGSEYRRSYTVLGDPVNLASRIESLTKYYGVPLLVGEGTHDAIEKVCQEHQQPEILFRMVDRVKVKGKHETVALFEPVCLFNDASGELCYEVQTSNEAIKSYFEQRFDDAENLLHQLLVKNPDFKLYHILLERIAEFRAVPPPSDWDGSITMKEK